jgi:hypothetical protein
VVACGCADTCRLLGRKICTSLWLQAIFAKARHYHWYTCVDPATSLAQRGARQIPVC